MILNVPKLVKKLAIFAPKPPVFLGTCKRWLDWILLVACTKIVGVFVFSTLHNSILFEKCYTEKRAA